MNLHELLADWTFINRPFWKKARAFKFITSLLTPDQCLECFVFFKTQAANSSKGVNCMLPATTAAFYLLSLDYLVDRLKSTSLNISDCLVSLVSCLNFEIASEIRLPYLASSFEKIITTQKIDEKVIQCSLFARDASFEGSFLSGLSKYLSELKGLPESFAAVAKFLKTAISFCFAKKEFIEMMDRLSKRNSLLASFFMSEIALVAPFTEEISRAYDPVIEVLCQVDNEQVIAFSLKIASKIVVSKSLLEKLQKSFKTFNPRSKEIVSKFIANLVLDKQSSDLPDFGEFLSKELNADNTLASLVQYAVSTSSTHLASFLTSTWKATQKFNTRTAILLGLVRAGYKSWSLDLLRELFSASFSKEAAQPSTISSLAFFVCAFVALIDSPSFSCDSKMLSEALIILSKPGSVGLGCEKGWATMDDSLIKIWIDKVVCPVVFSGVRPELFNMCSASVAWFIINGNRNSGMLILKRCCPLSLQSMDSVCQHLLKLMNNDVNEGAIHKVWKFIKAISSSVNLTSYSLALLCHHDKLLGNGDASWPEIVRMHVTDLDAFCSDLLQEPAVISGPYYLLISIISLSPQVVLESIQFPSQLFSAIETLKAITPSEWDSYFSEPEAAKLSTSAKSATSKPAKPSPQGVDNSALKESINAKIANLKVSLSRTCAVAQALPYHSHFTSSRPEVICRILDLLLQIPKLVGIMKELVPSIYTVAAESFDGQGPLLISLCLQTSNLPELVPLVDSSWHISNDLDLFSSCVEIAKKMESSEFFIVCETFSRALASVKDFDVIKTFISILEAGIKGVTEAKFSCEKMLMALLDLSIRFPALAPLITVSFSTLFVP